MQKKTNDIEFKKEVKKREIECLIHFTSTLNLYSILEHKHLFSRALLENIDVNKFDIMDYITLMDDYRYDDKNYINLSLSAPNTYLLSRFREKTADDFTIKWCILKIDPKHIYQQETLFSVTNAASSAAKNQYGIGGDITDFTNLFSNELTITTSSGTRKFTRRNLADKYSTDVQAEVLVKDSIPVESIISVCFDSESDLAEAKAALQEFDTSKFIVDHSIFSPNRYKQ